MKTIQSVLILGGDRRQPAMADAFEKAGFRVQTFGLQDRPGLAAQALPEAAAAADAVILPLPCSKDETHIFGPAGMDLPVERVAALCRPPQLLLGGMLTPAVAARLARSGCRVLDYYKREEIVVRNLVPTVQGLLKLLLQEIDYTLWGSRCAVLGYGRLGRAGARMLTALGARVTVCARSAAASALAEIEGCDACDFPALPAVMPALDFIINTVPAPVLGAAELQAARPGCLILDAASAPFGTDFAAAERCGLRALQCGGLPAKTAPQSAGVILAQGILHLWEEEGYV